MKHLKDAEAAIKKGDFVKFKEILAERRQFLAVSGSDVRIISNTLEAYRNMMEKLDSKLGSAQVGSILAEMASLAKKALDYTEKLVDDLKKIA